MKRDQKLRDRYGYGGNGCRKKENDFRGFTRKILVESTEMCYDTSVGKIHAQIWFIGRTLASQAGKAGSTPVICLFLCPCICWIYSSFPCKYKGFRFSMWIFDINNLQSSRRIGAAWAQIPPSSVIQNLPLHIAKLNGRVCGAKRPHSVSEQPIYTMSR